MPNHCYQGVYLHGSRLVLDRLHAAIEKEEFLNAVVPEPDNLFTDNLGKEERQMCKDRGIPNWYDWRNEHWGTKWDICSAEVQHYRYNDTDAELSFRCWTAWSPPVPVWDRLQEMGIRVEADYEDEGGFFVGTYSNGVDRCWAPEEEAS